MSPETVAAIARAAAESEEIVRVVLHERVVEPRSEPAFTDTEIVIVLADPPDERPSHEFVHGLLVPFREAIVDIDQVRLTIPSAIGEEAATRGGTVVYERDAT